MRFVLASLLSLFVGLPALAQDPTGTATVSVGEGYAETWIDGAAGKALYDKLAETIEPRTFCESLKVIYAPKMTCVQGLNDPRDFRCGFTVLSGGELEPAGIYCINPVIGVRG